MPILAPVRRPTHALRAFTLIELLTVIAIVAVLGGLLFSVLGVARTQAKIATATAQFRQIATAVLLYTNDNKSRMLPGPLASGQNFEYSKTTAGAQRTASLMSFLASYLDLPLPSGNGFLVASSLMTPAQLEWAATPGSTANGAPIYYAVPISGGLHPFGYASTSTPYDPTPITQVDKPGSTRMIAEADQKASWVFTTNGWFNRCPPGPLHGNVRLAAFFDGGVRVLPASETNRQ